MTRITAALGTLVLSAFATLSAVGADVVQHLQGVNVTGGLVAQVGSDELALTALGDRFHVRLLLPDAESAAKAQAKIERAGLAGRFTAAAWDGEYLPFADRVLNALILADEGLVANKEAQRVLAPRGMLITPTSVTITPVPDAIDDWTHYLYDASGNAVSRDAEVASPRSFRWNAPPRHFRSHNHSPSFTGLVTAGGRVFHFLDEGTFLFDKGGATERWSLVARDAFNGALLWKKPLKGYGQPYFEDVAGQAVRDLVWRTPLSMNRRLVAVDDRIFAALSYRGSALSILDAASGKVLHEVELGGVDEIVVGAGLAICRVRPEIPMPTEEMKGQNAWAVGRNLEQEGFENPTAELRARVLDRLRTQTDERLAAVDAESGKILWQHVAPRVAVQSLAMADGKVVYHNYQELVALDANTGEPVWTYPCPVTERLRFGARNMLGNLLIADGKVLWTSSTTGGGVCLNLSDGAELWKNGRMGTTGGFAFPTAQRVIDGMIYRDMGSLTPDRLADGSRGASVADLDGMLRRGHHIRCFPGKATERFLITPMRGAEFIDLHGDNHMVNDWLRGACSLGNLPANGLFYVTPDPCSCYAGARIYGFSALAPKEPVGLEEAPAADDPVRLDRGPAYSDPTDLSDPPGTMEKGAGAFSWDDPEGASPKRLLTPFPSVTPFPSDVTAWPLYRANAMRTAQALCKLSAELALAWNCKLGGNLTQATLADGNAFIVRKTTYQLLCLDLTDGKTLWTRSFPAALDGPPTLLTAGPETFCYLGSRDGRVHCLRASDGAMAWSFLAAPLDRLTLSEDCLESLWPVSSSVLFHNGLIYAVAGRNSYLDGGIRLVALDPATGAVKHHAVLEGPWPDVQTLKTAVITERDRRDAAMRSPAERDSVTEAIRNEYATGYHLLGGEADLLVTDGEDIFLTQNKFDAELNRIPLKRDWISGYTPMDAHHMMAGAGFLDDTMFHRIFMVYDDAWPSYGSGPGSAARGGTVVAVGRQRAYAAQHFERGGYAVHDPGSGNRIVADNLKTENFPGGMLNEMRNRKGGLGDKAFDRDGEPLWSTQTPVIIRSILVAPDGCGDDELVFTAGIVEGTSKHDWDKSTYFIGPGKLQVHNGADGKLLAEYDLPACPVFDAMSAADGRLLIPMVNGEVSCWALRQPEEEKP